MKRVGVVCEFNPFHNGHLFLLQTLRDAGAKEIVCMMSDSFAQRCEPCVLPARDRAEMAVRCGADAVLALPFPWSASSAAFFAEAGMFLLQRLGCDTVAFGSECGDISLLKQEAEREIAPVPAEAGTATAFARLGPNDILGTAYIRACRRLNYAPDFYPVLRQGEAHGSTEGSGGYSSTAVREDLHSGTVPVNLPEPVRTVLQRAMNQGLCPLDKNKFYDLLFAAWRVGRAARCGSFAECGGGVAAHLCDAAARACTGEEMFALAATKKYTDARLRRAALFGCLEVEEAILHEHPAYTRLLALGERGREVLRSLPDGGGFYVVPNVRKLPASLAAAKQNALEVRAEALLTVLFPRPVPAGTLYKSSPVLPGDTQFLIDTDTVL